MTLIKKNTNISLCIIHQFVFLMDTKCVLCEIQTNPYLLMSINRSFKTANNKVLLSPRSPPSNVISTRIHTSLAALEASLKPFCDITLSNLVIFPVHLTYINRVILGRQFSSVSQEILYKHFFFFKWFFC